MNELLTVEEVLGIAIQMEANAAAFYRRAAALRGSDGTAACLQKLAAMEDGHKKIFAALRDGLKPQERETGPDLRQEGWLFVSAIAEGYGVEGSPLAAERLTGKETLESVLTIAVNLEKQAILFYLALRDVVSSKGARSKVERIIAEEKTHVVTLMDELLTARGKK